MNLYVGNLPISISADELGHFFAPYGTVTRAQIVLDPQTGRPTGFGLVELVGARAAVDDMNAIDCKGRRLTVSEARPRETRRREADYAASGFGRY